MNNRLVVGPAKRSVLERIGPRVATDIIRHAATIKCTSSSESHEISKALVDVLGERPEMRGVMGLSHNSNII